MKLLHGNLIFILMYLPSETIVVQTIFGLDRGGKTVTLKMLLAGLQLTSPLTFES